MIAIDTLQALIENGYGLSVHCHARDCWNAATVDLQALAKRLGGDHSCMAQDLKRYFLCSKCGSRDVGFVISPRVSDMQALSSPAIGAIYPEVMHDDRPPAHRRRRRSRR